MLTPLTPLTAARIAQAWLAYAGGKMFNVVLNYPIHPRILALLKQHPIAYNIAINGEQETKSVLVDHIRQQMVDKFAQRQPIPMLLLPAPKFIPEEPQP